MKNKLLGIFLYFFFSIELNASSIQIQAKNITLDKDQITSIFKDQVIVKSNDKIIVFTHTDFPEPVVPAINKCGIEARSPIIGRPEILLPKAIGSLISFF